MRALPGRISRTELAAPTSGLTRHTVGDAQRARIRRATGELVAKRGYAGVTVELIVKRARVGFKTFYKHYPNKEAAFADLLDHALARTQAEVGEGIAASEASWPDRVAIAIRAFFGAIISEPLIARACLVEAPTAGPGMIARYDRVARAFVPLLAEGREFEPAAAALPATLEDTLAGAILWSAHQRLIVGEIDRIKDLLPEAIELLLRPYVGERVARQVAANVEPL